MKVLKPGVDYDYIAAVRHVRNATDSKIYYFAILKEDEERFFDSWGRIDECFDYEFGSFALNKELYSVNFTDTVNVFSLVDGPYVYAMQCHESSIVKVVSIYRCNAPELYFPHKALIAPVDYTDVYLRDMKKKRKNDITNKMREKKNKYIKEHLVDWLAENDKEAKDMMTEYFNLTGHQFSF